MRKFKLPKVVTVIGQGTLIEGNITFSGGLHLDGKIRGNVLGEPDTQATLIISELGEVEGEVRTDHLITNGTIRGDVHAGERVELADNARITGTVHYRLLEMAMGAEVNGQLVHRQTQEPRQLAYQAPRNPEPPLQLASTDAPPAAADDKPDSGAARIGDT